MNWETYNGKYRGALERYIAGERPSALARELGVAEQNLHSLRVRLGIPARHGKPIGTKHWNWQGGAIVDAGGYRRVLVKDDHLLANERKSGGYVYEHRKVMAEHLGRPLVAFPFETVHHLNGDKLDNRIENLQLRAGVHGRGTAWRCRCCGSNDLEPVDLD